MSSKEQYKDALKNEKRLIINMREEIAVRDNHVRSLEQEIRQLTKQLKTQDDLISALHKAFIKSKHWYQIIIKVPMI